MPNYDYECTSCGLQLEIFHSMSAEDMEDCPECERPDLVKLISAGLPPIIKGTENPYRGRKTPKPKRRDRLGEGKNKSEKPFWRKCPVNNDVLKDPEHYIKEGKVD